MSTLKSPVYMDGDVIDRIIVSLRTIYLKNLQVFIPSHLAAPRPCLPCYWPDFTHGIITLYVEHSLYPQVTGSTSMRKDQRMGNIHESRATVSVYSYVK